MKKIIILLFLPISVGLILLLPGCYSREEVIRESYRKVEIDFRSMRFEKGGFGSIYLIGTLKNKTNKTLSFVSITFSFCDKNNVKVSEGIDLVSSLEPGQKWEYRVLMMEGDKLCPDGIPHLVAY